MNGMFSNCSSLTSLDLSSFDTSNVTDMSNIFSNCSSLINLDLSDFDTSKVTDMSDMFSNCSSLTSLDLSSFDTLKVTKMSDMFSNCSSLANLDIRKASLSWKNYEMFSKLSPNISIIVKDENIKRMIKMWLYSSTVTVAK